MRKIVNENFQQSNVDQREFFDYILVFTKNFLKNLNSILFDLTVVVKTIIIRFAIFTSFIVTLFLTTFNFIKKRENKYLFKFNKNNFVNVFLQKRFTNNNYCLLLININIVIVNKLIALKKY